MILVILGCGVVGGVILKKSKAEGGGWIVITVGFGLAVAMAVYAVGDISGGHINPAVTLGLAAVGSFPWEKVPLYITAQILGGFIGGIVVFVNYLPHWKKTENKAEKLVIFSTSPAIPRPIANFISEMGGTFVLMMGILFIGANEFTQGLNPLLIGLLVTGVGMGMGGATGFAINPARDLGPRIAHALLPIPDKGDSDWGYAWIPIAGPLLGGVYGALFYQALFLSHLTISFWFVSAIILFIVGYGVYDELVKVDKTENIQKKVS